MLLALAGGGAAACFGRGWWQRPERPRKKFNKICFLGLHGRLGRFTGFSVFFGFIFKPVFSV